MEIDDIFELNSDLEDIKPQKLEEEVKKDESPKELKKPKELKDNKPKELKEPKNENPKESKEFKEFKIDKPKELKEPKNEKLKELKEPQKLKELQPPPKLQKLQKLKEPKKPKNNEMSDYSDSNSDDEKKRGPGRPRINKPHKKIPRNGIVNHPTIFGPNAPDALKPIVEISYENPFMFKKIFNLFKGMGADSFNIKFEKNYALLYTKDHLMKSIVYVIIRGERINSYYRGEPLAIKLSNNNIQKVLQTVNKGYGKITIYTTKQFKNKSLYVIMHDDELDGDSINEFEIDSTVVDQDVKDINQIIKDEETYPIKIEMPFKAFKRKINEMLPMTERVRFVKNSTGPLYIQLDFGNSRGNQKFRFSNPAKVNLRSTVDDDTVFNAPLNLSYIKPLAASLISDTINISLDSKKDAIFTSLLDFDESQGKKVLGTHKCCIKMVTQLIPDNIT